VSFFGIGKATACKLYNGKLNIVINPPGVTGGSGGMVMGEVGRHMVTSKPVATGSPSRWKYGKVKLVGGIIPPGLKLLSNSKFQGTPKQHGYWEAELVYTDVRCGGNQLGDHYIEVRFYINK